MEKVVIRREIPADFRAAEELTREAFWNVYRPGCMEHYLLHVLRDDPDFIAELDLVMERDGQLIGHIMYMRAEIHADGGNVIPVMTFGPVSIRPDVQRMGYGTMIVRHSMRMAAELGAGALCIEGNAAFYGKCGFAAAYTRGIRWHGVPEGDNSTHNLLCEMREGFLDGVTGVYYTPQGYFVDDAEVEEFDKSFPKKEKGRPLVDIRDHQV